MKINNWFIRCCSYCLWGKHYRQAQDCISHMWKHVLTTIINYIVISIFGYINLSFTLLAPHSWSTQQLQSTHYMWPNLRKATFHAHIKTQFSQLNDTCSHWLTIQAGIDAESCLGCFCCGLFLRPVRCPQVLVSPSNGYISPWQADSYLKFTT